jgi:tetratricopeptide (TPR) repeat protein
MADQRFFRDYNEFFLDLHHVRQRDAARAIQKRIGECHRFGIKRLTVVYGTPEPPFEGSVAHELHRIVQSSPEISAAQLPPEFLRDPELFTRRVPKVIVNVLPPKSPDPQDESMGFVGFKASLEKDRLRRRVCENAYFPLRKWVSLRDAAKWIGDRCTATDVGALLQRLRPDEYHASQDHVEAHVKVTVQSDALPRLAEFWWSGCREPAAVPSEMRMDVVEPQPSLTVPDTTSQSWRADFESAHEMMMAGDYEAALAGFQGCISRAEVENDTHAVLEALHAVGQCEELQFHHDEAEDYYRMALEVVGLKSTESSELRFQVAFSLGNLLMRTGNIAGAADVWSRLRNELKATEAAEPGKIVYTLAAEAQAREELDNLAVASELLAEAIAAAEAPNIPTAVLADVQARMAIVRYKTGRLPEALSLFQSAARVMEAQLGVSAAPVLSCLVKVGDLLSQMGQNEQSQLVLKDVLERTQSVASPDLQFRARTLNQLGIVHRARSEFQAAESCYREAMQLMSAQLQEQREDMANMYLFGDLANNMGVLLRNTGRLGDAEEYYRKAIEIWIGVFGHDHPKTAEALNNLGILYDQMGRHEEAGPLLREALQIREIFLPADHPAIGFSHNALGVHLMSMAEYDKAESHLRRALEIRRALHGDANADTVRSIVTLCSVYLKTERYAQARPLAQRAIDALETGSVVGADGFLPQVYMQLGSALLGLGNKKGAHRAGMRAVALGFDLS